MFVVDTSVLVYAANADSPHHAPSRRLLEDWRQRAMVGASRLELH